MSNDDAWSNADKIPPMVYVPPPDADAPAGRGGIIGVVVLMLTIVCLIGAGGFSIRNWYDSEAFATRWFPFVNDGGVNRQLNNEIAVTNSADAPSLERYSRELFAQNRALCNNARLTRVADLQIPNLQRQILDARLSYDSKCRSQGRSASCDLQSPTDPTSITLAQRADLCTQYQQADGQSAK